MTFKSWWILQSVSLLLQYQTSQEQLPVAKGDAEQPSLLEAQTHNVLKFKFLHESGAEERLCQEVSARTYLAHHQTPTRSKPSSLAGTQCCCCTGKAETRTRSCRWGAHLGKDLALWTPHLAEATHAHSPTGPIWFWSHNLQIHVSLLSFLSLPWHPQRQLLLPWWQPPESELPQR